MTMSDKFEVFLTPEAQTDIRSIILYIAQELANPQAALNLNDAFSDAVMSLEYEPKRSPIVDREPWKDKGIRRLIIKNYLVYYIVVDDSRHVYVLGVIYAGRDQAHQMHERGWENLGSE